jgi:hypothetical protein
MQRSLIYLILLSICLLGRPGLTEEIVTGQETSSNQLPGMSEFTRSGGTSIGTGAGCSSGEYCTAGKHGPGGTYSTTFDLEDAMTIDQINRGFDLNYGMDVDSHSSNTTVPTCGGNTMAAFDCKDIFKLMVSLFDENSALQYKFEHEVELTFSGVQTYSYSQTVPENTYAGLTGEFEMFGIDAGFPAGFYGPQFFNPALTATYDLVTFIETEIIDVIQQSDILNDSFIQTAEVDLAPPPPPPDQSDFEPPAQEQQQQQEAQTEVEQEIEAEVAEPEPEPENEPDSEATPSPESSSSSEEAQPEPEAEAEPESNSPKVVVKKTVKEKIAKRIMKRMGDKGRYDASNQLKTLVVMQVLGNSKTFFETTAKLKDTAGFFSKATIPDAVIDGNNFAQYILFGGSNAKHDAMVNSQYR